MAGFRRRGDPVPGLLIAFEGLDQSGKQTQAELLRDRVAAARRPVRLLSFPAYDTPIGAEIGRALRGDRDYSAEVMQLLYVANRYERKLEMAREIEQGTILICDRYVASSVAYGEAQGLDPAWLTDVQRYLPQPDLTLLLDITPDVSLRRKTADRDRYERDLMLLSRVRESYRRQSDRHGWLRIDADRPRNAIAAEIHTAISAHL
jgi:dTMP kinase